ncbi:MULTISPECIES: TIGR00730 family Rossman fold protein [Reichenbachiella]|uniref:Cytokinin riboside 5'-monophosphate phosphoribohydrolase n=1 Tax=Reichenbachiella agariperforans TaxID=156994 RepID=A0A1M6NDP5_REIAG|nr:MULTISPECIES: TIGR00730 family Rossman fold protein [Reichenbachiella]RJE71898.1 Rossman fold protein, TIGR00730 family [Reichenbachiella sp. MSK19-1]SHJ93868.1 hypothetical protein SAMN04488028_102218 [Reichenbachiella agariperforans]
MNSICVYCGSSTGNNSAFVTAAQELGKKLAEAEITMVYGGAALGLMGTIADSCLDGGGSVVGVIPKFLDEIEISHDKLTEIVLTESMHERKTSMADRADAFVAMPGGFGTLEELMEVLTWSQLGLIQKPIGILNVNGYYDPLMTFFDHMLTQGLIKEAHMDLFVINDDVEKLLEDLRSFEATKADHRQKLGLV